jgi:hypothetical protein
MSREKVKAQLVGWAYCVSPDGAKKSVSQRFFIADPPETQATFHALRKHGGG